MLSRGSQKVSGVLRGLRNGSSGHPGELLAFQWVSDAVQGHFRKFQEASEGSREFQGHFRGPQWRSSASQRHSRMSQRLLGGFRGVSGVLRGASIGFERVSWGFKGSHDHSKRFQGFTGSTWRPQ